MILVGETDTFKTFGGRTGGRLAGEPLTLAPVLFAPIQSLLMHESVGTVVAWQRYGLGIRAPCYCLSAYASAVPTALPPRRATKLRAFFFI